MIAWDKIMLMERCFVLFHYEYDWHDLIPEPYLSMVILAIVIVVVVAVIVSGIRKKHSKGRAENLLSDEEYLENLIEAKRKREDARYVGDKSTAIPMMRRPADSDESIWVDEGK